MSITRYLIIFLYASLLLCCGCGDKEIPESIVEDYSDGMEMFLSVYREDSEQTEETTVTDPVNNGEIIWNVVKTEDGNFVYDRKKLREQINKADFNEINRLVGNGEIQSAIRKLEYLKSMHSQNPFVVMECSMYLSDIHKNRGNDGWKKQMDDVVRSYEVIKQRKDVQSVFQQSFENDAFVRDIYPTEEINAIGN